MIFLLLILEEIRTFWGALKYREPWHGARCVSWRHPAKGGPASAPKACWSAPPLTWETSGLLLAGPLFRIAFLVLVAGRTNNGLLAWARFREFLCRLLFVKKGKELPPQQAGITEEWGGNLSLGVRGGQWAGQTRAGVSPSGHKASSSSIPGSLDTLRVPGKERHPVAML